MCVPWESNPQPFALLTQCSTTEPPEHSVPVMLGLSSAFDTVDHEILISCLVSHVGLGGELNWFKSFLTNRRFVVKTGSFLSTPGNLTCGVPQGSILSPALFSLLSSSSGLYFQKTQHLFSLLRQ